MRLAITMESQLCLSIKFISYQKVMRWSPLDDPDELMLSIESGTEGKALSFEASSAATWILSLRRRARC